MNSLPSLDNLWKRRVVDDPSCGRCKARVESASHALFDCKESRKFWQDTRFASFVLSRKFCNVLEMFLHLMESLDSVGFNQFSVVVWAFWNDRNAVVNGGKSGMPHLVASRALLMLEEFSNSKTSTSVHSPPLPPVPTFDDVWLAPPSGKLKLNSAVVVRKGVGFVSIGSAIQDCKGKVLAISVSKIKGLFPSDMGHLLALSPQPLCFDRRIFFSLDCPFTR
jgi:hypothetical protein